MFLKKYILLFVVTVVFVSLSKAQQTTQAKPVKQETTAKTVASATIATASMSETANALGTSTDSTVAHMVEPVDMDHLPGRKAASSKKQKQTKKETHK